MCIDGQGQALALLVNNACDYLNITFVDNNRSQLLQTIGSIEAGEVGLVPLRSLAHELLLMGFCIIGVLLELFVVLIGPIFTS